MRRLTDLFDEHKNVLFYSIDAVKHQELAKTHKVVGVPTIQVWQGSDPMFHTYVGPFTLQDIVRFVTRVTGLQCNENRVIPFETHNSSVVEEIRRQAFVGKCAIVPIVRSPFINDIYRRLDVNAKIPDVVVFNANAMERDQLRIATDAVELPTILVFQFKSIWKVLANLNEEFPIRVDNVCNQINDASFMSYIQQRMKGENVESINSTVGGLVWDNEAFDVVVDAQKEELSDILFMLDMAREQAFSVADHEFPKLSEKAVVLKIAAMIKTLNRDPES